MGPLIGTTERNAACAEGESLVVEGGMPWSAGHRQSLRVPYSSPEGSGQGRPLGGTGAAPDLLSEMTLSRNRFGPARLRDVAILLAASLLLVVADRFLTDVSWWLWAGIFVAFLSREFTRFRMRRLDAKYAPNLTGRESEGRRDD